jgi:membrane-associated phospholipid phosphatase
MNHIFIFLISFSFTFSQNYLTKADIILTSTLEGKNNNPIMDVAMEGLAIATPFIEFGSAGLNQIGNEKLVPSFATTLGVQLPIALGKYFFKRERPQRHYNPRMWNSRFTPSFPSGHAATTVAWATAVTLQNPELFPFMVSYTFLSGYSQVYVGNHYVSDVIAGWVVGYAVAFFSNNLINNKKYNTNESPQLRFSIPLP